MLCEAIDDFFECYESPARVKELLWELLVAAMGSDLSDNWSRAERVEMLSFYMRMGNLVESAFAEKVKGEG